MFVTRSFFFSEYPGKIYENERREDNLRTAA
jgi:hypothetical protein